MKIPDGIAATSDAQLRAALDAMPHKVWMVRPEGPALYYNRAMRAFAGGVLELPDRASREEAILHADDLPRLRAATRKALAHPEDFEIELRLRGPEGLWIWHRLNFSMLRIGGRVEAWLVTATDIDELRQAMTAAQESSDQLRLAAEAAQESSDQLRLAAEAAQLGIFSFDLETREHIWSPELKAIYGLPSDAAAPEDILANIHPDDREGMRSARAASFDPQGSGVLEHEHRIQRPDGSIRWVMVKGRVSFAGTGEERRARRGVGFVLDITQRKAAERALAESEQRYRTLVDNANDIVATLDLDGRFTSVNPATERIMGYTREELVGRLIDEFIPPEEVAQQDIMLRRKLEGEPSTQYELDVLEKGTGRRVTLDVKSQLTLDEAGRPASIHSIARDVTERKEAEARQMLLVRELQHRTKNLLAVVQSIATSTLTRAKDLKSALESFVGRLHALAHAQEFVAAGPGAGVPLQQLIEAELATFAARATVDGVPVVVGGSFAQMFALVVHELATNAAKHGSLSTLRGRVAVRWSIDRTGAEPVLRFHWTERDGPPVVEPTTSGLGSQLISLLGKSDVRFKPEGLEYALEISLAEAQRGTDDGKPGSGH
ncbi:MAG TPA: PAS domain S-box protein [Hyphomicrobiaceae bacterium]|nr:PAS domain S-box protein [Hyphomicrobiaceae bacterium]